MSSFLLFAALGLGAGAVYALLALGLVLQQRSSGVINFAHGAVAMFVAYVYAELRTDGRLALPWVGLPGRVRISGHGLAVAPAIAVSLVYAAVLGMLAYALVFRPLRPAPVLGKVVASVGFMLALQGLATLKFGTTPQLVGPIVPNGSMTIDGLAVPVDRLWLAAIAIALAAALWAVYRFTRFGLATRAAAEQEQGAALLGYSPDRLALVNWAIAAVLAGIAGILIAPLTTLDPTTYTLFVVPALAAALVARFESFPIAVAAGLLVGVVQSEMPKLQAAVTWLPQQGLADAVPLVLVVAILMFGGRALPDRLTATGGKLSAVPRPRAVGPAAAVGFALGLAGLLLLSGEDRLGLILSMLTALIALSAVLLTGYLGQISLAQMSFAGLGGFVLAKLATSAGIPFPLSLLGGALGAVPLGLIVGAPALRVRGVQLAVVTLATAVALQQTAFQNPSLVAADGSAVPHLSLFGLNLDVTGATAADYPRVAFGVVVLVVLTICGLWIARLPGTPFGRRLLAVRADERAAAAAGISVAATKLTTFGIAAFIAGLGGGLLGYQEHVLSASSFGVFVSLQLVAVVYIGGITRVSGAVVGGLLLVADGLGVTLLNRWFGLAPYQAVIGGVGLMAMAVLNQDGIVAANLAMARAAVRRAWPRRDAVRPELAAPEAGSS